MDTYRELCLNAPQEYEPLRASAHRFAKEVMRPAAIALDRMADPEDTIAPGSPLRQVLKQAHQLGFHVAGIPVAKPMRVDGFRAARRSSIVSRRSLTFPSSDRAL